MCTVLNEPFIFREQIARSSAVARPKGKTKQDVGMLEERKGRFPYNRSCRYSREQNYLATVAIIWKPWHSRQ